MYLEKITKTLTPFLPNQRSAYPYKHSDSETISRQLNLDLDVLFTLLSAFGLITKNQEQIVLDANQIRTHFHNFHNHTNSQFPELDIVSLLTKTPDQTMDLRKTKRINNTILAFKQYLVTNIFDEEITLQAKALNQYLQK